MNGLGWVFAVIAAIALIGFIVWAILRYRYVKSLRDRGWEFVTSPDESVAYGLNHLPFGMGIRRAFDDLIHGTQDGLRFRVFEYKFQGFPENRVTVIDLPRSLPEYYLCRGSLGPIHGTAGPTDRSGAVTYGATQEWNDAVTARLGALTQELLAATSQLSIDTNHVVLLDTPKKTEEMAAHIALAARAAQAIAGIEGPEGPRPLDHLGFRGTDWRYETRNDAALRRIAHSTGGFDHEARDVISGPNDGLPFIALQHDWKTRHQTTDSDGKTKTEIRRHTEYLMEVTVPFPFSPISFNAGWFSGGQKRRFESITFDKMFAVRSAHPKFAHDVIHPRTMQWMESRGRVECSIERGRVQWEINGMDPEQVALRADWCHGFFGRVPDFVWKDLGLAEPPRFRQVD